MRTRNRSFLALVVLLAIASHAGAQEVVLDRQVRAGELTLFPSATSPNDYYYVADKARLAEHGTGMPQFSFLQYVDKNVSAEAAAARGTGGGIVHALVELGVTDQQLSDARTELRRVNGNGRIVGPVAFKSGKFALISSFAEAGSDMTHKVLGVGTSPLLENEKAAISLNLTPKGAEVLWESFRTPTPDISFSFSMEIDGFRSPKKATIEADFDRIYQNRDMQAGVATPWLQAEIQDTLEDLRSQGAIRITQVGEDEDMDALIQTAYERLTELIFDRGATTGTPSAMALAGAGGTDSILDKASALLETRRKETREENDAARERNDKVLERNARAAGAKATADSTRTRVQTAETSATEINQRAASMRRAAQSYERRAAAATNDTQRNNYRQLAAEFNAQAQRYETMAQERTQEAKTQQEQLATQEGEAASAQAAAGEGKLEEIEDLPSIAVVASYRMKTVRQRGTYRIDLNKYAAGTLSLRFDENIGDLRRFISNSDVFRTVNVGDSAFRQREIPVFIDGLNTADFGEYINFVTVLLRKKHENGTQSTDEIRIDRTNFQQAANNFKLSYLKLGDSNASKFLDYEYKVAWNFFGGEEVAEPWKSASGNAIGLNPPYQKRSVFLDADPDLLAQADIRSVEFRLHYKVGAKEHVKRVSLRPKNGQGLSQTVNFMLPADSYQYEYELSWTMKDGSKKSSGRVTSEDGTVFFDRVTEA